MCSMFNGLSYRLQVLYNPSSSFRYGQRSQSVATKGMEPVNLISDRLSVKAKDLDQRRGGISTTSVQFGLEIWIAIDKRVKLFPHRRFPEGILLGHLFLFNLCESSLQCLWLVRCAKSVLVSCMLERRRTVADCLHGCSRVRENALDLVATLAPCYDLRLCLFDVFLGILALLFVDGEGELVLKTLASLCGTQVLRFFLDAVRDYLSGACRY